MLDLGKSIRVISFTLYCNTINTKIVALCLKILKARNLSGLCKSNLFQFIQVNTLIITKLISNRFG